MGDAVHVLGYGADSWVPVVRDVAVDEGVGDEGSKVGSAAPGVGNGRAGSGLKYSRHISTSSKIAAQASAASRSTSVHPGCL
jgi:hypothetical protein